MKRAGWLLRDEKFRKLCSIRFHVWPMVCQTSDSSNHRIEATSDDAPRWAGQIIWPANWQRAKTEGFVSWNEFYFTSSSTTSSFAFSIRNLGKLTARYWDSVFAMFMKGLKFSLAVYETQKAFIELILILKPNIWGKFQLNPQTSFALMSSMNSKLFAFP